MSWASSASDWRQTPSNFGSLPPYSAEGNAWDGEGDGSAAAGAAAPITATAARAAALRRTFMIGGCLSLWGSRAARGTPGGSAPYTSTVPCTGGLPGT